MNKQVYQELVKKIQERATNVLPKGSTVLVVSRGDEQLLNLTGCTGWHLPQDEKGAYLGYYPTDSTEAIQWLEQLRAKGGDFLLLPETLNWWLEYYAQFRCHLENKYRRFNPKDDSCIIYDLRESESTSALPRTEVTSETYTVPENGGPHQIAYRGLYQSYVSTACESEGKDFVPLARQEEPAPKFDVKLIAFYLPQFHPIPENDEWWGKGFTEWTNSSKAVPQFEGHYQPHLPGELGFYDLRVSEVQRRQVELAKQYGLSGFCFYYYWFAGKRLLERPLNQFMSDAAIDFPFCVCWANENWSRRWDGRDEAILIGQNHSEESDFAFICDIEAVLRHKNYIRVGNRPLLIVYRPALLPNAAATAGRWREYCQKKGLGDPYLVAAEVFESMDPRSIGFDAVVEFPPNTPGQRENLATRLPLLNSAYEGQVYRYSDMARWALDRPSPPYRLFRTVCPAWDNEPRRPGRGSSFAFSSPAAYRRWLEEACRVTLTNPDPEERLVFVNAWNEWGEGAHLEPDRRYGYAYLQATVDALETSARRGIPCHKTEWTILFVSHDAHLGGSQTVLLNLIQWLKEHTRIRLKVLCLTGGPWLPRFKALADTITLSELQTKTAAAFEPDIDHALLDFCGGKPDLIYGNSVASGEIYNSLRQLNVPIVTHVHELRTSIERYAGKWIGAVLDQTTRFVACSDAVRDHLTKDLGVAKARVSLVHAAINTDPTLQPLGPQERAAVRRQLGLVEDKPLIFGCGVGMPYRKGADLFIKVARQFRRQSPLDCHFYWIGDFDKGHYDPEHGRWGDHLEGLSEAECEYITFLGEKSEPRRYLQAADLFLLPSREDPFPLVALEAAECGLPIICFQNAGGMTRFVARDAGYVVPFEDTDAMARRVKTLVEDYEKRNRLGSQARAKLLAHFTSDITSPQILSVCRTVAKTKPYVSVIVPNYNHARFLPRRLDSILNQTFRDFEIILLDDASTDDSAEVIEQYREHPNVRVVRNEKNSGSTFKQWLKGIEMAKADILWIAESDDRCEPDFLEALLPAFNNRQVKLAYANSHVIDTDDKIIGDYISTDYLQSLSATKWTMPYTVSAEQEVNDGLGVKNTILSASSVLFRRFELEPEVRKTIECMRIAGDWYFIIHGIAGGNVHYVSRKLNYHRRHCESVVGKLLQQNRATEFFREFYIVQSAIFGRYGLLSGFAEKWEKYLNDQWTAFFPDRPFEELSEYYPVDRARGEMRAAVSRFGSESKKL